MHDTYYVLETSYIYHISENQVLISSHCGAIIYYRSKNRENIMGAKIVKIPTA